jgi:hypothetical protein
MQELNALRCCSNPYLPRDGGVVECLLLLGGIVDCNQLPPADFLALGEPYGEWRCQRDEGFGERFWQCGVWVRDGGVVGACGDCPPD